MKACRSSAVLLATLFSAVGCAQVSGGDPRTPTMEEIDAYIKRLDSNSNSWLFCDGNLTSLYDEGFCADEVPDQWIAFEYQGETYYIQPLAGQ